MATKVYICKKCATAIEKDSSPSGSGCPKGGNHTWHHPANEAYLSAKSGFKPYQCKHCGIIIYTKTLPSGQQGCPAKSLHAWHKL